MTHLDESLIGSLWTWHDGLLFIVIGTDIRSDMVRIWYKSSKTSVLCDVYPLFWFSEGVGRRARAGAGITRVSER